MSTKSKKNISRQHITEPHFVNRAFCWAVTGTFHGALIEAKTEGEARFIFHKKIQWRKYYSHYKM